MAFGAAMEVKEPERKTRKGSEVRTTCGSGWVIAEFD